MGSLALMLPWERWGVRSTAVLAIPAWLIVGTSTWAFGEHATGTGPFYVLMFAWLGLHHSRRMTLSQIPLAAVSYAGALVAAGAPSQLVGSTLILIPIAVGVGLVIWSRMQLIEREHWWRTALVATLAHDVRSPLSTIQSVLEILSAEDEQTLSEDLRPLLAAATRQAARISILTSNLLDLERIDAGRLRLELEELVLADTACDVIKLLGCADVRIEIDPSMRLRADRIRLEQMLVNLTTNALRHGAPPVVLSAEAVGGWVRISVRDHGPDVPAEHQAHLFERLRPTDTNPSSVGLGLWIVGLLANAHGGGIDYRAANPGAEFIIHLPTDEGRVREGMSEA